MTEVWVDGVEQTEVWADGIQVFPGTIVKVFTVTEGNQGTAPFYTGYNDNTDQGSAGPFGSVSPDLLFNGATIAALQAAWDTSPEYSFVVEFLGNWNSPMLPPPFTSVVATGVNQELFVADALTNQFFGMSSWQWASNTNLPSLVIDSSWDGSGQQTVTLKL